MKKEDYIIVQDGAKLDEDNEVQFRQYLDYRDIRSNSKGNYINFVGFIFANGKTLISFPKNYFATNELKQINKELEEMDQHIKILYQLIKKCMGVRNQYLLEVKNELNHSYPFIPFLHVFEYFQNYGLFTIEDEIKKFGSHGRISWKDTFRKSPMIYNSGNILYWPPVIRKRKNDFVFVSKCITYVINSTLIKYKFLFDFHGVDLEYRDIDFSNNKRILKKLYVVKQGLFKDIHIQLIEYLISFFKNENYYGNKKAIKIYSFHLIWEEMVRERLNSSFTNVDNINKRLNFDEQNVQQNRFNNHSFELDARRNSKEIKTYKIIPDYFYDTKNVRYIFDAKYYTTIEELDYKQISYYYLLKQYGGEAEEKDIYNALILPTSKEQWNKTHFQLDEVFSPGNKPLKIKEYYLNIQWII